MPTIELCFKEKIIQKYIIGAGDTLLIGRNKVNDIVIDNLAVSAQHAKIISDGNGFFIVDLQSENGTFVNDQLVKSFWLNDGDTITIGKHNLKFSNPRNIKQPKKQPYAITKTMQMDTKKFRELIKKNIQKDAYKQKPNEDKVINQRNAVGILSYLSANKEHFRLNDKLTKIGKDPNCDIPIKGFAVGKTAAVINKLPEGWYITYVGGFAKPRVNNKILKTSTKLNNLDVIAIGSTTLQFLLFDPSQ